jgi:hypothetical protein
MIHAYVLQGSYVHTYIPTYILDIVPIRMHTYIYTYINVHIYIYIYKYICMHTYTHTYIHTYIHTHRGLFSPRLWSSSKSSHVSCKPCSNSCSPTGLQLNCNKSIESSGKPATESKQENVQECTEGVLGSMRMCTHVYTRLHASVKFTCTS